MFPWTRPPAHAEFLSDADALLVKLRKDIADNRGISFNNREIWTGSWFRRSQTPGLHKTALIGPDWPDGYAKCTWCECWRDRGEIDVEHYRPKGAVTHWEGTPGYVSNEPPKEKDVSATGYWWLAFSWPNYSLSCNTCNRRWKRNLFPVTEPRPPCIEGVELTETPLLLEPGSLFRTKDHFRWTDLAIMEPESERGYATIVTCGLNRKSLQNERLKVLRDVNKSIDDLRDALPVENETKVRRVLRELRGLGARTSEFTSMVRWVVEKRLECEWEDLDQVPP